ncbi:MAG TPA: PEGA domain-containing protein [Myxococcota bacterium]|nr:PEGA domain-containing protein [Myxococcota bacterium]HQK51789.1 PEGA domain-containing protein [Myxococcota bacterium]
MKERQERDFRVLRSLRRGRGGPALVGVLSLVVLQVGPGPFLVPEARAQAASQGDVRRLMVRVVPKDARKDATAALVFRGLIRRAADRLGASGLRRASGVENRFDRELETVQNRVEAGYQALMGQRWAEALEAYRAAETALQPALAIASRNLVARVYKGLGISLLQAQKQLQAKDAIKRSLVVYPGQQASEYAVTLEARNFFRQVQQEIEEAPETAVEVLAEKDAEVYLDGEFKGFAPIKIGGVKPGDHWVTVMADGFQPWSQFVVVRGVVEQQVEVTLKAAPERGRQEEALRGILRSLEKALPEAEARALAESSGATDLLVIRVSQERNGFAVRGLFASGTRVQPVQLDLARDGNLVVALQDLLVDLTGVAARSESTMVALEAPPVALPEAAQGGGGGTPTIQGGEDLIVDPNSPIFKDTSQKPKKSNLVRQWWFWTALVVGVGAVAGLTYWGVTAGGSEGGGGPTGDLQVNLHGIR